MLNKTKKTYYKLGVMMTMAMSVGFVPDAFATVVGKAGGGADASTTQFTWSSIGDNIINAISDIPGLLAALSYMFGVLLGTLGVMKIKDHVENPSQTPLKDGAIRLAAGGALFALPIVFESMINTVGKGTATKATVLNKVDYKTNAGT